MESLFEPTPNNEQPQNYHPLLHQQQQHHPQHPSSLLPSSTAPRYPPATSGGGGAAAASEPSTAFPRSVGPSNVAPVSGSTYVPSHPDHIGTVGGQNGDVTPNSSSASLAPSANSSSALIQQSASSTPPSSSSIYQKGVSGLPSPYVQNPNVVPLAIATMSTTNVNNISFIDDGASEMGEMEDPNLYHHRPHLMLPSSVSSSRDHHLNNLQRPNNEDRVRGDRGGGGPSAGGRSHVSQPPPFPSTEEEPTIYYSLHV